jgi:hypothetical protein
VYCGEWWYIVLSTFETKTLIPNRCDPNQQQQQQQQTGYFQRMREENNIDPNRDFPYMKEPQHCMQTITARALNELWRSHLFQLAITYHGGMRAIAYEWGAPNHAVPWDSSPDENAQAGIAGVMATYGGAVEGHKIPAGRLNRIVYPVTGGMEDWGYAASWENDLTKDGTGPHHFENGPIGQCNPDITFTKYKPYPPARTSHHPSAFAAFNILVETSDMKRPRPTDFGHSAQLFKMDGSGQGHIPRNIRFALVMIDIVQPYIQIMEVEVYDPAVADAAAANNNIKNTFNLDEVDPESGDLPGVSNGKYMPVLSMVAGAGKMKLSYEVGGGITVTETDVIWCKYSDDDGITNEDVIYRRNSEASSAIVAEMTEKEYPLPNAARIITLAEQDRTLVVRRSRKMKGATQWSHSEKIDRGHTPFRSNFGGTFDIAAEDGPGVYFVIARARLDTNWGERANGGTGDGPPHPNVDPQSHIVRARTLEDWRVENDGHVIDGRLDWYSVPIKVIVHPGGGGGGGGAHPPKWKKVLRGGAGAGAGVSFITNDTTSAASSETVNAARPFRQAADPSAGDFMFLGSLFVFLFCVGGIVLFLRRFTSLVIPIRYSPILTDPEEMSIEMGQGNERRN